MKVTAIICMLRLVQAFVRLPAATCRARSRFRFNHDQSIMAALWNTGDSVAVGKSIGTIFEIRGNGWYSVKLPDGSIQKFRSSQLQTSYEESSKLKVEISSSAVKDTLALHSYDDIHAGSLDATLKEQLAYFSSNRHWIVFTDLHVSISTLDTCLQVLRKVHSTAMEWNAGIIFLGDWWHVRGTLRVDMLNAVLDELSSWSRPMICIPGNHDQVTMQTTENHGLIPLQHAYRCDNNVNGVLIISHPTVFLDALWIPHIRCPETLKHVLQSDGAREARAIMCHADVTGASMNDLMVSNGGISPSAFPAHTPVYTGHFHKPHTVGNSCIEYVGSPYQVSLSEAGQQKALFILDSANKWQCVHRVELNIGRRHFRAKTIKEFLAVQDATAGDRVVYSCSTTDDTAESQRIADEHVARLRAARVMVEIHKVKQVPKSPMVEGPKSSPELSTASLWTAFLKSQVKRGVLVSMEDLEKQGMTVLERLDADQPTPNKSTTTTDLQLHSVSCEGFGPFRNKVTYPLHDRGLVLLRGQNKDGGSDSNGSGKTSLAMSILWALTGSIDPRPLQDSKVSDVVNDLSKVAKVTVEGDLNGVKFSISRMKSLSKGSLTFILDGKDLTAQSMKDTQVLINERLGVSCEVLARVVFHGQHAVNELLDATDAKLKDELSLVVPIGIWQSAVALTRAEARSSNKRIAELDGMLSIRSGDVDKLQKRLGDLESSMTARTALFEEARERLQEEIDSVALLVDKQNLGNLPQLEDERLMSEKIISGLESERDAAIATRDLELVSHERQLVNISSRLETATVDLRSKERELSEQSLELGLAKERVATLERTWRLDLSSGKPITFDIPFECPTCQQPISDSSEGHSHQHLQGAIANNITVSLAELDAVKSSFRGCEGAVQSALRSKRDAELGCEEVRTILAKKSDTWNSLINDIDSKLQEARLSQQRISSELGSAATQLESASRIHTLEARLAAEKERVARARATVDAVRAELVEYEERVAELESEKREHKNTVKVMTNLSEAFGQRGIQTFLLQNAVSLLETASQTFLSQLSEGAQRLELSLDASDRISRRAFVRGGDGIYQQRALGSLSGGQYRRCSLAVNLGFADLVARSGNFRPSLCVCDEQLSHLDHSGRAAVGRVLRGFLRRTSQRGASSQEIGFSVSTILVILQDLAAEELEESFDCIDDVVKENGFSTVLQDVVS